jgi:hypothetical protein
VRVCTHPGHPDQLQPEILADGQACPRCGISMEMGTLLFAAQSGANSASTVSNHPGSNSTDVARFDEKDIQITPTEVCVRS